MKPILKIKRGNARPSDYSVTTFNPPNLPPYSVQSGLSAGELGIDTTNNVFYIGNNARKAITFGCPIDADVTLGSVPSNLKVPTQKAVKTYVDTNVTPSPPPILAPKERFLASFTGRDVTSNVDFQFFEIYAVNTLEQTANMGILYNSQVGSGFYQTSKTYMILHVNYSLVISSIDTNALRPPSGEGNILNAHRVVGLRAINKTNPTGTNQTIYYAMNSMLPVIGSDGAVDPLGLPTLVTGSAIIRLPRFVENTAEWELQLVYKFRSQDLSLGIANMDNGVNDPQISNGYGLRIEMLKLFEEA